MPTCSSLFSIALVLTGASVADPGVAEASTVAGNAAPSVDPQDQDIVVTGENDKRPTTSIKLPLTLKETPQSVTVVDRQRMDDFNLTTITDVLAQTPGVTISSTDSNRTISCLCVRRRPAVSAATAPTCS